MTEQQKTERIVFRASPELAEWLAGRDERTANRFGGARARVELETWRRVLALEADRTVWTLPELAVMAQAMNGTIVDDAIPLHMGLLAMDVADLTTPGPLPTDWGCDTDALVAKLRQLGPAADLGTVDAIARWWAADQPAHTVEGWAAVGLRAVEGLLDDKTARPPGEG